MCDFMEKCGPVIQAAYQMPGPGSAGTFELPVGQAGALMLQAAYQMFNPYSIGAFDERAVDAVEAMFDQAVFEEGQLVKLENYLRSREDALDARWQREFAAGADPGDMSPRLDREWPGSIERRAIRRVLELASLQISHFYDTRSLPVHHYSSRRSAICNCWTYELWRAECKTVGDVAGLGPGGVGAVRGVGPVKAGACRRFMEDYGLW